MDNSLKKWRITSHSNKIGLYDSHKQWFIAQSGDVVLSFPYKDCVLEWGMSDEESGREEKFFHETLDRADIDVLRDPKVLTKFEKIDTNGIHTITNADEVEFFDEDGNLRENLLIKWNNLIALYSLRQRLAGKVKLIYIDPPYNTWKDSFLYNDSFNHSTWLVFMKNRLEIARELLRDDGVIFISCDDNEQAYLRVLMDEIFQRENFVSTLAVENNPKGRKNSNYISISNEFCLIYAKNKDNENSYFKENLPKDKNELRTDELGRLFSNWKRVLVWESSNKNILDFESKKHYSVYFNESVYALEIITEKDINIVDENLIKRWFRRYISQVNWKFIENTYSREEFENLFRSKSLIFKESTIYEKDFNQFVRMKSLLTNDKVNWIDLKTETASSDLDEFGLEFSNPKNVSFIKLLLRLSNSKQDIVLDFFAWSWTTWQAVLELNQEDWDNRRLILIEQMTHMESVTKPRMQNVIKRSKLKYEILYLELKTYNIEYLERIEWATTKEELQKVYIDMAHNAFLQFWFDRRDFEREGYKALSLEEQKIKLRELLDMNHLYLNALDMDDTRHRITPLERSLTTKFYGNQEI